jgi:PTS system ascorbate-specific IIA component
MSVGFVIVTHGQTGKSLIAEAEFVLGQSMKEIVPVSFNQSEGSLNSVSDIRLAIEKADSGDGVLVMTDLIGASPSNRVARLLEEYDAVMVTGVNLPMTICVWNYREQPLGLVVRKAVDGGRRGIKIFQE